MDERIRVGVFKAVSLAVTTVIARDSLTWLSTTKQAPMLPAENRARDESKDDWKDYKGASIFRINTDVQQSVLLDVDRHSARLGNSLIGRFSRGYHYISSLRRRRNSNVVRRRIVEGSLVTRPFPFLASYGSDFWHTQRY